MTLHIGHNVSENMAESSRGCPSISTLGRRVREQGSPKRGGAVTGKIVLVICPNRM